MVITLGGLSIAYIIMGSMFTFFCCLLYSDMQERREDAKLRKGKDMRNTATWIFLETVYGYPLMMVMLWPLLVPLGIILSLMNYVLRPTGLLVLRLLRLKGEQDEEKTEK